MKDKQWAKETMDRIVKKIDITSKIIGAEFPHVSKGSGYDNETADWWTSGFWPGILWIVYRHTGKEELADIARSIENKMDKVLDGYELLYHDVGFMWVLTSGANYRLNHDKQSRIRLLKAASHLAGRFNVKGNYIRAWNSEKGWAIIDCVMNLPLLYWAAKETGDSRFAHIAEAHVNTVLKYFVRPDGSVNHIISFDSETGDYIEPLPGQAARADSAWSRGTAWAIYGLALAYGYFKNEEILMKCKQVANFFLANLPDDNVAHWDFRVERTEDTPRDSSAAACAACGLLELSKYVPGPEADIYAHKAYLILRSLTDNYSNLDNDKDQALLRCATGDLPGGNNINVGLIYGDYFYVEAISRLSGNTDVFWYSN